MPLRTLIQPEELDALLQATPRTVVVFDCTFDLADPNAGRRAFEAAHLPGALYLHLDEDLSGAKTGRNGRHPLPERAAFATRLRAHGLNDDTPAVVYDRAGGMMAARLWWMLRWIGHEEVALLDGGLGAWQAGARALETGAAAMPTPGRLTLRPALVTTVDRQTLLDNLAVSTRLVVDARAGDRFRGENETLDPLGGRIPGAAHRFFKDNLGTDGRFKSAAQLRAEFESVTGGRPAADLVMQCGSGVTACHNLLALEHAGLPGAALYPGSWSEWSAWPGAPVATGPAG